MEAMHLKLPRRPTNSVAASTRRAVGPWTAILAAALWPAACAEAPDQTVDERRVEAPSTSAATAPTVAAPTVAAPTEALSPPPPSPLPRPQPLLATATSAALGPAELRIAAGTVEEGSTVLLELVLINPSAERYALAGDLGAADLRLHDADGMRSPPTSFSPELERLEPDGGLAPGRRVTGWARFPRPPGALPWKLELDGFEPLQFDPADLPPSSLPPAAPTPSADGATPVDADLLGRLERLLEIHAEALLRYDVDTYLATFDPARRGIEQEIIERRRLVPLERVEMRLAELPRGDGDTLRAAVQLGYGLQGLPPDNPFLHTLDATFTRHGDTWLLAGLSTDVESEAVLWRRGALAAHRSNHFHLYAAPSLDRVLPDLAREAESAYAALQRRGLPLASGYLVLILDDPQRFESLAGMPGVLGVTLARYRFHQGYASVDSQAFYLNGSLLAPRGPKARAAAARRELTVAHELVHLALATRTTPFTPAWLKEGTAVYFSGDVDADANRALVRRGLDRLSLESMSRRADLGTHDTAVDTLDGEQPARRTADEYLFAGNVVDHLLRLGGGERFLRFYGAFAEVSLDRLQVVELIPGLLTRVSHSAPGEHAARLTDEILESSYGLNLMSLETAVKTDLRTRHRGSR